MLPKIAGIAGLARVLQLALPENLVGWSTALAVGSALAATAAASLRFGLAAQPLLALAERSTVMRPVAAISHAVAGGASSAWSRTPQRRAVIAASLHDPRHRATLRRPGLAADRGAAR